MSLIKILNSQKLLFRIFFVIILTSLVLAAFIYFQLNNRPSTLTKLNISQSMIVSTSDSEYTITGIIEHPKNVKLFINNANVEIRQDGAFRYKINLNIGKNNIEITLLRDGKRSEKSYVIIRTKKENNSTPTVANRPAPTDIIDYSNAIYEDIEIENNPTNIKAKPVPLSILASSAVTKTTTPQSSAKDIISFDCSIKCIAIISENTIDIKLLEAPKAPYTLTPIIEISPGAIIDPASLIDLNFGPTNISHTYTVTAADNSTKTYIVNISVDDSVGYSLVDTNEMTGYPWNESNCWMSGYWSMGGADGNGGDGHGYGCRQSASYVAWRIAKETGKYYSWGNAVNFTQSAINAGYEEGAPQAGSIAVMDPATSGASEGHIAWVEAVNDNTVTISQYNYNYGAGYGMYSMMNMSASAFDHYIHIK